MISKDDRELHIAYLDRAYEEVRGAEKSYFLPLTFLGFSGLMAIGSLYVIADSAKRFFCDEGGPTNLGIAGFLGAMAAVSMVGARASIKAVRENRTRMEEYHRVREAIESQPYVDRKGRVTRDMSVKLIRSRPLNFEENQLARRFVEEEPNYGGLF